MMQAIMTTAHSAETKYARAPSKYEPFDSLTDPENAQEDPKEEEGEACPASAES